MVPKKRGRLLELRSPAGRNENTWTIFFFLGGGAFYRHPSGVRVEQWRRGVLMQDSRQLAPSVGLSVALKDNEAHAKPPKGWHKSFFSLSPFRNKNPSQTLLACLPSHCVGKCDQGISRTGF